MRNLISLVSLLILVSVFTSCGKDEEKVKDNLKFVGIFVGEVNCEDETEVPTILDITAQANSDNKVNVMLDTDDEIIPMVGTVTGNTIVLDKVEVEVDTYLSGTGTLSGNVLTVAFEVEEDSISNICTFIGTK
jgi:hypothetical protein